MAVCAGGYCIAQSENDRAPPADQVWDSVNIMALVAANASLGDADHVANGRRLILKLKNS